MKIFKIAIASLVIIPSVLVFCLLAAMSFYQFSQPWNTLISLTLIGFGFVVNRNLFNLVRRRGAIEVLTSVHASPDLDNLKPNTYSGVNHCAPNELVSIFEEIISEIQLEKIRIWGDWEGRKLNETHKLINLSFDSITNVLFLEFDDFCHLQIRNPQLITYSKTYLKIINAQEILWQIRNEKNQIADYFYLHKREEIIMKSNTDWQPHKYDVGVGMNALFVSLSYCKA